MKIKFDVEATPQELRIFFGLPDVEPLQQEMIEMIRKNMHSGIEGFDPAVLMKPWLPQHLQSMETVQKAFWQAFQQGMTGASSSSSTEAASDVKPEHNDK